MQQSECLCDECECNECYDCGECTGYSQMKTVIISVDRYELVHSPEFDKWIEEGQFDKYEV